MEIPLKIHIKGGTDETYYIPLILTIFIYSILAFQARERNLGSVEGAPPIEHLRFITYQVILTVFPSA